MYPVFYLLVRNFIDSGFMLSVMPYWSIDDFIQQYMVEMNMGDKEDDMFGLKVHMKILKTSADSGGRPII